jgi:hypothetical protein
MLSDDPVEHCTTQGTLPPPPHRLPPTKSRPHRMQDGATVASGHDQSGDTFGGAGTPDVQTRLYP